MIYLDHAATTPMDPEVLQEMMPFLTDQYGNPSSLHKLGQAARAAVDKARMSIASNLSCQPTEIFFTSSGTESCNWAIFGCIEKRLLKGSQAHIIVSAIEHSAVLETARFLQKAYGVQVTELDVSSSGIISPDDFIEALRPETVMVSAMYVNNEIGTLQPIAEIGKICRQRNVFFHSDACQAAPFFSLHPDDLNVDMLSFNASKINGPKAVGALFIKEGTVISPWTFGGGQEFGMRAGTENVAGIVGLAKALEQIDEKRSERVKQVTSLRDGLWNGLQQSIPEIELNGDFEQRTANNLNFYIPGVDGQILLKKLDLAGFAVSSGSACASGKSEPSHVLLALGHSEERAKNSIRVSLSHLNTEEELESFVKTLGECVG